MRRYFAVTILGLGLTASPFAAADILGAGVSAGYWNAGLSGEARQGGDRVGFEDSLDVERSNNVQISAALEHPVPVLPNIRLGFTRLDQSGEGQLSADFGNLQAPGTVQVRSSLDLDMMDLTFYYEILDNWVNLDAGITARSLDGELLVEERGNPSNAGRTEIDVVVPMLYVAARFDVPATGISFGVSGNGISYGDDSVFDFSGYGQYDISALRLQAGYRQLSIDVEDGDEALDVKVDGPFISVGLDF